MLIGATGTGKELFARHVHELSRRPGELVDVNCGALPQELAESLLFGHRKGAFTGAVESVRGHLERANRGTLFLDEVLHLTPASQVKLLRAIETGQVQPLGDGTKRQLDLRILAAAQDDACERVETGAFRHDLYQRLAGIVITLPRLADRREDIVLLAEYFANSRGQVLETGAEEVLGAHDWPGNVRELRLAIERAGCLVENGSLPPSALADAIALGTLRFPQRDRRWTERRNQTADRRAGGGARRSADELLALCDTNEWDARRVAEILGVSRSAVYARLRQAGVSIRSVKKSAH
jgi:DNA-binding NtrC family response regulator